MFPGLGQYLNGNVVGDQILFDEGAGKSILRLGCGRESHFNFLEPDFHQVLEEFQLLFQAHGHDQRLIAVPQVHTAPYRRMIDIILLGPFHLIDRGHKIPSRVFFYVFHRKPHLSSIGIPSNHFPARIKKVFRLYL